MQEVTQAGSYHPDRYYVDTILDQRACLHREEVVSRWRFWWTYLTHPGKYRRWRRTLREKDGFSR
jgi:hypothetical protein